MPDGALGRRPVLAAVLGSAILWTAFSLTLGPRYATNDDPLIAMLAAGTGFAAAPDPHLIFTNVLVGRVLNALFTAWPERPWYAAYLLCVHVVALAGLLFAAMRASPRPQRLALCILFFAVAAAPFANNLQFTVAAFVAAQAGVLLALGRLAQPSGGALAAASLLIAGSLVRFESFALVLALAAPVGLVLGWGQSRRTVLSAGLPLAAGVTLAMAALAFDAAVYARDSEWAGYREFNRALRPFVDFDRAAADTPESAAALKAVGWSRNDHRLLLHWFHPHGDVFSTGKLRTVLAQVPEAAGERWERLGPGLARMASNRAALPIFLSMPLALALAWPLGRARWAVFAAFAASGAVLVLLIAFRKAPPHVYLPVLAWPLAVSLVLPAAMAPGRRMRAALAVSGVLAGIGLVRSVTFQRQEAVEGRIHEGEYGRALQHLSVPPGRLYILWATFPYHVGSPMAVPGAWPGVPFVALGWPYRTPAARSNLLARGYGDVMEALRDPRVRLVAPPDAAGWIEQYARRHGSGELRLVQESSLPGFGVFRPAAPAAGAPADRVLRSSPAGPE